jgi:membrane protease YdiL (CAAX protease family)
MKKVILALITLVLLAGVAETIVLHQMQRLDPVQLGAVLLSFSLVVGAFVGLSDSALVRPLRHWAASSMVRALAAPLVLLVPYFIYALGTKTLSLYGFLKLTAYIVVPVGLLLPDRMHRAIQVGWRDFAAMLALGLPISANWLGGIWTWPFELYFFRPLTAVCVGVYAFVVVRNLDNVGYKLMLRRADWIDGLANFVAFALLALPLGFALHFIRFHPDAVSLTGFAGRFLGIYLTIAIPEELLFRGILQNSLVRSIRHGPQGLYGLLISSVIFGASHLHHPPVPNWRYGTMASLAGIFYGNAYRTRRRLSASALTHALVDTAWHFWF